MSSQEEEHEDEDQVVEDMEIDDDNDIDLALKHALYEARVTSKEDSNDEDPEDVEVDLVWYKALLPYATEPPCPWFGALQKGNKLLAFCSTVRLRTFPAVYLYALKGLNDHSVPQRPIDPTWRAAYDALLLKRETNNRRPLSSSFDENAGALKTICDYTRPPYHHGDWLFVYQDGDTGATRVLGHHHAAAAEESRFPILGYLLKTLASGPKNSEEEKE